MKKLIIALLLLNTASANAGLTMEQFKKSLLNRDLPEYPWKYADKPEYKALRSLFSHRKPHHDTPPIDDVGYEGIKHKVEMLEPNWNSNNPYFETDGITGLVVGRLTINDPHNVKLCTGIVIVNEAQDLLKDLLIYDGNIHILRFPFQEYLYSGYVTDAGTELLNMTITQSVAYNIIPTDRINLVGQDESDDPTTYVYEGVMDGKNCNIYIDLLDDMPSGELLK